MNTYEQKQADRKNRLAERAERKQAEANRRIETASSMASHIPFGQPILIGHHSEGRDRNYRKRIDQNFRKGFELNKEAASLRARANSTNNAISSDDPDAVIKLREKLAKLEANQTMMKTANKLLRKGDLAGLTDLVGAAVATSLQEPDFCGRKGFADYQLTNNNANIKRIKGRIDSLEREESKPAAEAIETSIYTLREDTDENRIMFEFPGKPPAEIRAILKSCGFKWSPTRLAWVRMLNNAGRYNAERAADQINKL